MTTGNQNDLSPPEAHEASPTSASANSKSKTDSGGGKP